MTGILLRCMTQSVRAQPACPLACSRNLKGILGQDAAITVRFWPSLKVGSRPREQEKKLLVRVHISQEQHYLCIWAARPPRLDRPLRLQRVSSSSSGSPSSSAARLASSSPPAAGPRRNVACVIAHVKPQQPIYWQHHMLATASLIVAAGGKAG